MASTTIAKCVYRVRHIIGNYGPSEGVSLPSILDALGRSLVAMSGKLPGAIGQNATIITLAANDNSYALSGEYHTLNAFQLTSTGDPVRVVSMPALMQYRSGSPSAPGSPLLMAFTETAAGVVTAEVWPTPVASDTIIGLRALVPTDSFQGAASSDLTATSLEFGVYGTQAILYRAAAELLPPASPGRMDCLRFAEEALRDEKYRVSRQRTGSTMGAQV